MSDNEYKVRMAKAESLFRYSHLPAHLQEVSRPFYDLATKIVDTLPPSAEATLALRSLWEAKNLAVFAAVEAKEVAS
ncbi:hypothetical protein vBRpoPV13_25 [Ruegeria phage vB_RpoP-V13]|uniref:Uncharacterized protein n=1 Tax=Ruegeria phage vB_RpoP-V13 TaxID=2218612 RepID=A0A2Z4QGH2_9CAUD|nr:hypothetical protein HYP63_gp25 [Ruegeria phage vB_RpoP-V13]AWY09382.1 hypothetical protein vBRpoPV13_25 [Ruegeria phage vB_RpoP-V13]